MTVTWTTSGIHQKKKSESERAYAFPAFPTETEASGLTERSAAFLPPTYPDTRDAVARFVASASFRFSEPPRASHSKIDTVNVALVNHGNVTNLRIGGSGTVMSGGW